MSRECFAKCSFLEAVIGSFISVTEPSWIMALGEIARTFTGQAIRIGAY